MYLSSYTNIRTLGHPEIRDLFYVPCFAEEKLDGSLMSFGVDLSGELRVQSKGAEIFPDVPPKLFAPAVTLAKSLAGKLYPGWIYRGEAVCTPKHNTLTYNRIPRGGFALFDVERSPNDFLSRAEKESEAFRLELEIVPDLAEFDGLPPTADTLRKLLSCESFLGGPTIEGIVIKPCAYDLFGRDGKALMGKFVSEEFKEKHAVNWKTSNPGRLDIITGLIEQLRTEARWKKAVQHLRDAGELEFSPRDIGKLIVELERDTGREEKEEICRVLWKWAWPQVARGVKRGLPEWYKQQLLDMQFEGGAAVPANENLR